MSKELSEGLLAEQEAARQAELDKAKKEQAKVTAVVQEAIGAGIASIRQKKEKLEKDRDSLRLQLSGVEAEISTLDARLTVAVKESLAALGFSIEAPPAVKPAAKAGGKRGRMTDEETAKLVAQVETIVKGSGKAGIKRQGIEQALEAATIAYKGSTLSKKLAELVDSKKIKRTGEKAKTVYLPA